MRADTGPSTEEYLKLYLNELQIIDNDESYPLLAVYINIPETMR